VTAHRAGKWFLRLLALGSGVAASIPSDSLPREVRPYMVLASGVILAVDRYVSDPSTGNPPPT
jgi:hypothetical protein